MVEHLVTHRGLAIDRDSAPEPGKIVFVYRSKVPAATAADCDHRPVFRKLAAEAACPHDQCSQQVRQGKGVRGWETVSGTRERIDFEHVIQTITY